MASRTFTFTTNTTWNFTGSAIGIGGTPTSSVTMSFSAFGAGGHGNINGTGGSGGAYAGTDVNDGLVVASGSVITIVVGQAGAGDGGVSYVSIDGAEPVVKAPGGKMDGTISHQPALLTGSTTHVGGEGGANYVGYGSYAGGGGGSRADYSADGVAGSSGLYATRTSGAPGGKVPNVVPYYAGSGSYYDAGANFNRVVVGGDGAMGCGGGGGYDYPTGTNSAGAGGNGYVSVTIET